MLGNRHHKTYSATKDVPPKAPSIITSLVASMVQATPPTVVNPPKLTRDLKAALSRSGALDVNQLQRTRLCHASTIVVGKPNTKAATGIQRIPSPNLSSMYASKDVPMVFPTVTMLTID